MQFTSDSIWNETLTLLSHRDFWTRTCYLAETILTFTSIKKTTHCDKIHIFTPNIKMPKVVVNGIFGHTLLKYVVFNLLPNAKSTK